MKLNAEHQKNRSDVSKKKTEYEENKKKRAEQRRLSRKKVKETQEAPTIFTPCATIPASGSKASEGKALKRVTRVLPERPRKQNAVVKKLAAKLFPSDTIFEKKHRTKKMSLLCEDLMKNTFDF